MSECLNEMSENESQNIVVMLDHKSLSWDNWAHANLLTNRLAICMILSLNNVVMLLNRLLKLYCELN